MQHSPTGNPGSLARIERVQELYNPFVVIDREALAAAAGAGPLSGVAVSVKDILDVIGHPTRWGSRLLAKAPAATSEGVAVRRLRRAGAVIAAKTTATEFAQSPLGFSPATGTTLNPFNLAFTSGGSSSGAGVAVATGATPIALTTDAGCSTRLPAALTGTVGFKPTLGRIPHERLPEGFANLVHLGIIAATTIEVETAFAVLAGPDSVDPQSLGHPLYRRHDGPALTGARVLLWLTAGNRGIADETRAAALASASAIEALGAHVEAADYTLDNPEPIWSVLQQAGWAGRAGKLSPAERDLLSPSFNAGVEAGLGLTAVALNAAMAKRTAYFRAIQSLFHTYDFILTPVASAPAVAADHAIDAPLIIGGETMGSLRHEWFPYLALFNLSGHPAIALPAGLDGNGVPQGVQLVARWGADEKLLAAARQYESVVVAPRLADWQSAR